MENHQYSIFLIILYRKNLNININIIKQQKQCRIKYKICLHPRRSEPDRQHPHLTKPPKSLPLRRIIQIQQVAQTEVDNNKVREEL